MLCERCHERKAIVHVTRIIAPLGEMTKHDFCESCFRETDTQQGVATAGWTIDYTPPLTSEGQEDD